MEELIGLIIVGAVIIIGTLYKSYRESKAAEERRRQLHPGPHPPTQPTASQRTWLVEEKPVTPIEQRVREFFEQMQAQGRQAQQRPPLPSAQPRPVQVTPPQPKPAAVRPKVRRVVKKPPPGVVQPAPTEEVARVVSGIPVVPKVTEEKPRLAEILASDRSDLGKAVVLSEILGKPVALRGSPVPRFRN